MVTAIVLLNVERNAVNSVAEKLVEVRGITEVYSVAGQYDLAVMIRVKDNDAMAEVVTEKMLAIDEITASETLIAFRAYSKHDLDSMFSIGFEE